MTTPKDVVIYYYGGSGGFYALHLLLLGNYYKCVMHGVTQTLDDIIARQWRISDIHEWKANETWPDNASTLASDFAHKVFFICNPEPEDLEKYPGTKIIIYTDTDTHWDFVRAKRCFLFYKKSDDIISGYLENEFLTLYATVRGDDWPDVSNISDYHLLPTWIKDELKEKFRFELDIRKLMMYPFNYRGIDIYEKYETILNISQEQYCFSLQELVQSRGQKLYQALELPYPDSCNKLTERYRNIHNAEMRKHLDKSL